LAGGGVKKMFLIDFDTIDHSNLNRQILFNRSDIGKSKSEVVRNEILEKFEIDVTSIVANCDDQGFNFPAADLIMVCGECEGVYDRPEKIGRVPVIRGGYDGKNGIIGPLLSINHGTPDWQNAVGQTHRKLIAATLSNESKLDNSWNSSGSSINTIVGGLISEGALRFLAGDPSKFLYLNEEYTIDLLNMKLSPSS
jgi:hypothetical protein